MSQCMLCASSQSAVQIICLWLSVTVLVDEAPVILLQCSRFCFRIRCCCAATGLGPVRVDCPDSDRRPGLVQGHTK